MERKDKAHSRSLSCSEQMHTETDDVISDEIAFSDVHYVQRQDFIRSNGSYTDTMSNAFHFQSKRNIATKDFHKRNSASQLEMGSRNSLSMTSPISRFFSSMSASLNRLNSVSSGSVSSVSSTPGLDADAFVEFTIPKRTIPPRHVSMTAKAELINHLEKSSRRGYRDVILSEMRDGRIPDCPEERPISGSLFGIHDAFFKNSTGEQ